MTSRAWLSLLLLLLAASLQAEDQPGRSRSVFSLSRDQLPADVSIKFLQDSRERVYLVLPTGVLAPDGDAPRPVLSDAVADATLAPGDLLVWTRDQGVHAMPLSGGAAKEELTKGFGGPAAGRRRVVCTPDGSVWVEGCPKRRLADGSFQPVRRPPANAIPPAPLAQDTCGNLWALIPEGPRDQTNLAVLPAQDPTQWVPDTHSGVKPGLWRFVAADDRGYVWLASAKTIQRLNPRCPEKGWLACAPAEGLPDSEITAFGALPAGGVWAGFAGGQRAEGREAPDDQVKWTATPAPGRAAACRARLADSRGGTWDLIGTELTVTEPPADAWQRHWRQAAPLPHTNHDLCGVECDGRFYVAGGFSDGFGYPAKPRIYDSLFEYDPKLDLWRVPAKLSGPRVYNAIAALDGKVWIIGGDVVNAEGKRVASPGVEVYDPKSGSVLPGPTMSLPRPKPIAATIGGRIYVLGGAPGPRGQETPFESIGAGETKWRAEPACPASTDVFAGCALAGKLYAYAPAKGLLVFDPAAGKWEADLPRPPQSPSYVELASHQGLVWLMGGRFCPKENAVQVFDRATATWANRPDLPYPIAWGASGEVGGQLIVAGGAAERFKGRRIYVFWNSTFLLRPHKPQ